LEAVENALHLGLAGLWDQVESIGGTITVEAESDRNIRLAAWLPWSQDDTTK
jgi:signal transduction histidine kinase